MAFVWDLIQQYQLHSTKSRAKSAVSKARSAVARTREMEARLNQLEDEVSEMRTTMAVLLDRLERRFGSEATPNKT